MEYPPETVMVGAMGCSPSFCFDSAPLCTLWGREWEKDCVSLQVRQAISFRFSRCMHEFHKVLHWLEALVSSTEVIPFPVQIYVQPTTPQTGLWWVGLLLFRGLDSRVY